MTKIVQERNKKETTTTVELCDAFGHKMLYIHFHNVKIF